MQIKIPMPLVRAADRLGDYLNIPLWQRGRIEIRNVDVWVAIGAIPCIGWYAYTGGWWGAVAGALLYIFVCMCSLWLF